MSAGNVAKKKDSGKEVPLFQETLILVRKISTLIPKKVTKQISKVLSEEAQNHLVLFA